MKININVDGLKTTIQLNRFNVITGYSKENITLPLKIVNEYLQELHNQFLLELEPDYAYKVYEESAIEMDYKEIEDVIKKSLQSFESPTTHKILNKLSIQYLKSSNISIELEKEDKQKFYSSKYHNEIEFVSQCFVIINKEENSYKFTVSLKNLNPTLPDKSYFLRCFNIMVAMLFLSIIPTPFYISGHRCFITENYKNIDIERLDSEYIPYWYLNEINLFFDLQRINKNITLVPDRCKKLLDKMMGGHISIEPFLGVRFIKIAKECDVENCGYDIRSMVEINLYINHISSTQDILIIEYPELFLHPQQQREMARLLSMLSNYGIKILIATQSDYIIKEMNTLLMLSTNDKKNDEIKTLYYYNDEEILQLDNINVYEELDNKLEKRIVSDMGAGIVSMDDEICQMGVIQRKIIY